MLITNNEQIEKYLLPFLRNQSKVGLDVETTGLDPLTSQILLLQIGNFFQQFALDIARLGDGINLLFDHIKDRGRKLLIIGHNIEFDYSLIRSNFKFRLPYVACTMIAEQLLNSGKKVEANLEAVVEKYLGIKLNKLAQETFVTTKYGDIFSSEQISYAEEDVKHLVPLYTAQLKLIEERKMSELLLLENETTLVTGDLKVDGIKINKEKWLALRDTVEAEAEDIKIKLHDHFRPHTQKDLFGEPIVNLNSPKQLLPLLSKICNTKFKSTDEKTLITYQDRFDVIKDLLEYRKARKRIDTYGQSFIEKYTSPVDKRIHSDFIQLGAESGRFASRNPNMTNIPRDQAYRTPFEAEPGFKIISADFSQQELRLLAQLSKEEKFIYALQNNMDLHCYSASLLNGIPYENFFDENGEVKKSMKNLRTYIKTVTFGLIYGMGVYKLAASLKIDVDAAKKLFKDYFDTFPSIKKLMDSLVENLMRTHIAESPLDGRRRDLTSIDWDNKRQVAHAVNIAKNMPFQGCGASTTKLAACYIRRQIIKGGYRACITDLVHDEILVEVIENEAEVMAEIVKTSMIKAFNHYAPDVPMEVHPIIGDWWIH